MIKQTAKNLNLENIKNFFQDQQILSQKGLTASLTDNRALPSWHYISEKGLTSIKVLQKIET